MKPQQRPLDWVNIAFLVATPLFALIATPIYIYYHGVHFLEIALFVLFYWTSGLGITMGYHRLFTHKAYEAHPVLKFFLLVFGAMAFEHCAIKWCSDHRNHHKHVDLETDPYNAKKGFWHSHILWIFRKEPPGRTFENVADLTKDKLVLWQQKYYVPLALCGWALPALIGLPIGRAFGCFLWAGIIRMVAAHHSTFFVNSVAHIWGKTTYDDQVSARDSWWVALLSFGEGYHSFHHRFQADYRNGVRWYHWDPAKWFIFLFSHIGFTRNLRASPDWAIISRRLEMDLKRARQTLTTSLPQEKWQKVLKDLEQARLQMEANWQSWRQTLAEYGKMKRERLLHSKEIREEWKRRIREQRAIFRLALKRWNDAIQLSLTNPAFAVA